MVQNLFPITLVWFSGGFGILAQACSTPPAPSTSLTPSTRVEAPPSVAANPEISDPASEISTSKSPISTKSSTEKVRRLTLEITDEGTKILSSVEAEGALNRRDRHRDSSTFFRVVTKDDRVLFIRGFQMPEERRAEFPDETGKMTRFQGPKDASVISIVVPIAEDADRLQLMRHKKVPTPNGAKSRGEMDEEDELISEVKL